MAIYRTSKCPHCSYVFEKNESSSKEKIGPPVISCPSCNKPVRTGMKYWKDFSQSEKALFWIRWFLGTLYSSFFWSLLSSFVIVEGIWKYILKNDYSATIIISAFSLSFLVLFIVYVRKQIFLMSLKDGTRNIYTSVN